MTTTILTAVLLGTMAGLAPGPYTTMVAGTALERGFKAGFFLALTPLITDVIPMVASALVLDRLGGLELTLLGITGGAIVFVIGIRFLREHSGTNSPLATGKESGGEPEGTEYTPRRQSAQIGHVILSTLFNPAPWLFWLIIASPLLLRSWHRSPGEGVLFAFLLFFTNISTATSLAWAASHGRKVLTPAWQRRGLKVVGVMLMLAGSLLCWQATIGNFQGLIEQQEMIRSVVENGISTG